MGAVRARKESPELVPKWEKLIKLVLKRQVGKARQSPFAQELGGNVGLVVTAHSYDTEHVCSCPQLVWEPTLGMS